MIHAVANAPSGIHIIGANPGPLVSTSPLPAVEPVPALPSVPPRVGGVVAVCSGLGCKPKVYRAGDGGIMALLVPASADSHPRISGARAIELAGAQERLKKRSRVHATLGLFTDPSHYPAGATPMVPGPGMIIDVPAWVVRIAHVRVAVQGPCSGSGCDVVMPAYVVINAVTGTFMQEFSG